MYYGVYNTILARVFTKVIFTIMPYYPLLELEAGVPPTVDSVVTFVVGLGMELPIFFLEIKSPLDIGSISTRVSADAEMRARFRALRNLTPTPRLHGVSVMGQRLAFYCLDKATGRVDPDYVAPSSNCITDPVPAERWDTDITTEDGYQRFLAVINDVKEMAAAL